jgi:integrase
MQVHERFQIGDYWLSQNRAGTWCRTFFDAQSRQTRRVALGTSDLASAKQLLAKWYVQFAAIRDADPAEVAISALLDRYAAQRGDALASKDTVRRAVALWGEFWGDECVADMTVARQEQFQEWLLERDLTPSYIRRILGVGKAALNRAWHRQEIDRVPYIPLPQEGEPFQYWATSAQLADFLNALPSDSNLWIYCLVRLNTGCRDDAARDLMPDQVDFENGIVLLNPPGRKQTKKRRPAVPLTQTLRAVLADHEFPSVPYVHRDGERVKSVRRQWRALRAKAKLPGWFVPKILRHTVATELRRRGVPGWEVSGLLGHTKGESADTTSRYAKFAPDYMTTSRDALDAWMRSLASSVPALQELLERDTPMTRNES